MNLGITFKHPFRKKQSRSCSGILDQNITHITHITGWYHLHHLHHCDVSSPIHLGKLWLFTDMEKLAILNRLYTCDNNSPLLLTMVSVRSQWGHYNLPRSILIYTFYGWFQRWHPATPPCCKGRAPCSSPGHSSFVFRGSGGYRIETSRLYPWLCYSYGPQQGLKWDDITCN